MMYIIVSNDLSNSVWKDVRTLFSTYAKKHNIRISNADISRDGLKSVAVDIEELGFRSDDQFVIIQQRKREDIHQQNSLTWLLSEIKSTFPNIKHPIIISLDASSDGMMHLERKIDKVGYVDTVEEYEIIQKQFQLYFSRDEVRRALNNLQKPQVDASWHWDALSQDQKEEILRYKESIKESFSDLFETKKYDQQGNEYTGPELLEFTKILNDLYKDIDSHRTIIEYDVEAAFLGKLKQVFSIEKYISKTLVLEYRYTNGRAYDVYLKLLSLIVFLGTDHFENKNGWYNIGEISLDHNQLNRKREAYELWLNEDAKTLVSIDLHSVELYDISSIRSSTHKVIVDSAESIRAPWIRLNSSEETLQERVTKQMNQLQANITRMRTSFTNGFDLSAIGSVEKQHSCQDILNMKNNTHFDTSVSKEDFFHTLHNLEEEMDSKNMRSVKGLLLAMLNRIPSISQLLAGGFIVFIIMLIPYLFSMDRVSLYHILHSSENIYLIFIGILIVIASTVAATAARKSMIDALDTFNGFLKETFQQQKGLGERFSKQINKILSNRASSENYAVYKMLRRKCEAALDQSTNARYIQAQRAVLQSIFGELNRGTSNQKPNEDFFDCQTSLIFRIGGGNSERVESSGFINKLVLENELS